MGAVKAPPAAPTPIATLHCLYELAVAADMKIEIADNALKGADPANEAVAARYEEARKKIGAETDALRFALLYQVPETWADAVILQFHLWELADLLASADVRPEDEDAALLVGSETLFDFMVAMLPEAERDALGRAFQMGTKLALSRRRTRTAELED